MRYVPENRKIMVISEDADNVMIFDEKFRVHTQVRCTLFVVFLFSLWKGSLNYFIKLLWILFFSLRLFSHQLYPSKVQVIGNFSKDSNDSKQEKNALKTSGFPRVVIYDIIYLAGKFVTFFVVLSLSILIEGSLQISKPPCLLHFTEFHLYFIRSTLFICLSPGREMYCYSSSDHCVTVCKEFSSMGGKKVNFQQHNRFYHNLLHLKLCWSAKHDLLCSVASDRVIYGWNIDTGALSFYLHFFVLRRLTRSLSVTVLAYLISTLVLFCSSTSTTHRQHFVPSVPAYRHHHRLHFCRQSGHVYDLQHGQTNRVVECRQPESQRWVLVFCFLFPVWYCEEADVFGSLCDLPLLFFLISHALFNFSHPISSQFTTGILLGHKRGVRSLSVYEQILLSSGFECEARLWELVNKDCIAILKGHRHPIVCAKLMCDKAQSEKEHRAITVDESGAH